MVAVDCGIRLDEILQVKTNFDNGGGRPICTTADRSKGWGERANEFNILKSNNMEHKKMFAFLIPTSIESQPQMAGLLRESFGGYANGYVAIPPDHPCYGKEYEEIDVEVHGGLTFGEDAESLFKYGWLCEDVEMLNADSVDDIPPDYYVVGFDTLHIDDNEDSCDREYCIDETMYLMEQLEEMYNN